MHTYKKGFRAEHELMNMLSVMGFAVLRAPKSGKDTIDMIACKRGTIFVFECKFWSNTVRIDERQMDGLIEFSQKAGAIPIIAIKRANEGWKFLKAEDVRNNKGVASKELLENNWFEISFFENY